MDPVLDEDGYLLMEGYSDRDDPHAADALDFAAPPPLPDSDWLAAVATAVATPRDDPPSFDEGADELLGDDAVAPGPGSGPIQSSLDWAPPPDVDIGPSADPAEGASDAGG